MQRKSLFAARPDGRRGEPSPTGWAGESIRPTGVGATEFQAVDRAIVGQDAVLSATGPIERSFGNVLTQRPRNLLEAMKQHDVDRLVTLFGAGVRTETDPSSLGRSLMLSVMKWFAEEMLFDAQHYADLVRATDLDWIIVRPPRFSDAPYSGKWRAGYLKLGPMASLSREDLAAFMLEQVESDEWLQASPMVTN